MPCPFCASLSAYPHAVVSGLVAFCACQKDIDLARLIWLPRRDHVQRERFDRLLAHLFQHQVHHRGQAHVMLSATSVSPPQLDEFFSAVEAPLRAEEFADLGWTEERIWGGSNTKT